MLVAAQSLLAAAASRPAPLPIGPLQLRQMLFWTIVVLIIFVFASLAIRRFSRAFKATILRSPTQPTATEDVWKMHRLPDEDADPDNDP